MSFPVAGLMLAIAIETNRRRKSETRNFALLILTSSVVNGLPTNLNGFLEHRHLEMFPEIRNREKDHGADIEITANVPKQRRVIASSHHQFSLFKRLAEPAAMGDL